MKQFPTEICNLPNLELLNLANNPQLESAVLLGGLKKLADEKSPASKTIQMLYPGNNNLTEIPVEFKNLKKLGKLDCNNNKITKVYPLGKDVNRCS
ncbi:leucine-rich repeat domain-containing protein [Bacteroides sp. BFG-551]|nr:leucine-rich repeat domain-containing protein [Bacteroides sp. BFG-551]